MIAQPYPAVIAISPRMIRLEAVVKTRSSWQQNQRIEAFVIHVLRIKAPSLSHSILVKVSQALCYMLQLRLTRAARL
jgi:hypothetical protein